MCCLFLRRTFPWRFWIAHETSDDSHTNAFYGARPASVIWYLAGKFKKSVIICCRPTTIALRRNRVTRRGRRLVAGFWESTLPGDTRATRQTLTAAHVCVDSCTICLSRRIASQDGMIRRHFISVGNAVIYCAGTRFERRHCFKSCRAIVVRVFGS